MGRWTDFTGLFTLGALKDVHRTSSELSVEFPGLEKHAGWKSHVVFRESTFSLKGVFSSQNYGPSELIIV